MLGINGEYIPDFCGIILHTMPKQDDAVNSNHADRGCLVAHAAWPGERKTSGVVTGGSERVEHVREKVAGSDTPGGERPIRGYSRRGYSRSAQLPGGSVLTGRDDDAVSALALTNVQRPVCQVDQLQAVV